MGLGSRYHFSLCATSFLPVQLRGSSLSGFKKYISWEVSEGADVANIRITFWLRFWEIPFLGTQESRTLEYCHFEGVTTLFMALCQKAGHLETQHGFQCFVLLHPSSQITHF